MAQARDREAFEQAVVRGSELLKQGKIDLAQSAFREALAVEPDNPRVLALLGLSHFRASAFTEARAIYEQLVDRAPSDASHRLNLGLVYLKLNDAERAIAALETSRALDPSQGRAVSYLGLAYARAGRYAEAYRAFLIAGQNDLASEIESNISVVERDRIHSQLGRSPQGPLVDAGSGRMAGAAAAGPAGTAASTQVGPSPASPAYAGPPHAASPASVPSHAASSPSGPVYAAPPHAASPASVPPHAASPASVPPRAASPHATSPASVPPHAASPASVPPHAASPASVPPQASSPTSIPRTVTPRSVPRTAAVTPATGVPRTLIEAEQARTPTPHVIPRSRPPAAPPNKQHAPSQPGLPDASPPASAASPSPAGAPSPAAAAPVPSPAPDPARQPGSASLGAVPIAVEPDPPAVARTVTPGGTVRVTESTQFVLPRADPIAPAQGLDGPSMISHAVASATPSGIIRLQSRTGGTPPRPLSDLATDDLIRPDEGTDAFEIAPGGALVVRIADRVLTRLDGVHITGGDLSYELAMRRSRGHSTEQPFDYGGSQLHAVTGRGYLIAAPGKHAFSAVSLDDDILYLREDLVFAFESSLRWENGNVPGLRGKLPVVQFRGDGAVALRLARPLVRVKLPAQGVVFIDAERLAGWIGRVIPRAVVPPPGGPLGTMCVECTGEGVVLIEPAPDEPPAARAEPRPRMASTAAPPPPPLPPADESFDRGDEF